MQKQKKQFIQDFSKIKLSDRAINRAINILKNIVIQTPVKQIQKIESPAEGQKIRALALSADGKMIVAAGSRGEDDNLKAYLFLMPINEYGSLGEVSNSTFMEEKTSIVSAAISPDNKKIAFVCNTNEKPSTFTDVFLATLANKNIGDLVSIHTVALKEEKPERLGISYGQRLQTMGTIAFNPNGTIMVAGGLTNKLHVWKCESNHIYAKPQIIKGEYGKINAIVFSADGRKMATVSDGGNHFLLWSISNDGLIDPAPKHIYYDHPFYSGYKIALSSDGNKFAIGVKDTVVVWDIHDINNITEQDRVTFQEWQRCDSLAFSPDNEKIIIQGSTESRGELILCDVSNLKRFHQTVYSFPYYREVFDGWGRARFPFKNRSNIGLFNHDNTKIIAAAGDSLRVFDISDRNLKSYDALSQVLTPEQAQLIIKLKDVTEMSKDVVFSDIDKQRYESLPPQVHNVFDKNHSAAFKIAAALKDNSILAEKVRQDKQQSEKVKRTTPQDQSVKDLLATLNRLCTIDGADISGNTYNLKMEIESLSLKQLVDLCNFTAQPNLSKSDDVCYVRIGQLVNDQLLNEAKGWLKQLMENHFFNRSDYRQFKRLNMAVGKKILESLWSSSKIKNELLKIGSVYPRSGSLHKDILEVVGSDPDFKNEEYTTFGTPLNNQGNHRLRYITKLARGKDIGHFLDGVRILCAHAWHIIHDEDGLKRIQELEERRKKRQEETKKRWWGLWHWLFGE